MYGSKDDAVHVTVQDTDQDTVQDECLQMTIPDKPNSKYQKYIKAD